MNPRLFPTLQELTFSSVTALYGEEVGRLIAEDEKAHPGIQVTVPGISRFKPLLINKVQEAVVHGDLNQTEELIKAYPLLCSMKGEAIDYSKRTIKNLTPFQAALCAMDNEMCEMFKRYMQNEEIFQQCQEIFPEGQMPYFQAQIAIDFTAVVDAITKSSDVDKSGAALTLKELEENYPLLGQTLNQFKAIFTLRSQQEIIFNFQHIIKAFEVYDEQSENWNSNQKRFFCHQIIDYLLQFLPANIAQDVAQGLHLIFNKEEEPDRSFFCGNKGGAIFRFFSGSFSQSIFDGVWMTQLDHPLTSGVMKKYMAYKISKLDMMLQAKPENRFTTY